MIEQYINKHEESNIEKREMKIIIKGTPKEIADLIREVQSQHIKLDGKEIAAVVRAEETRAARRSASAQL